MYFHTRVTATITSFLFLIFVPTPLNAFSPLVHRTDLRPRQTLHKNAPSFVSHRSSSMSSLWMVDNDDGPGPLVQVGILLIMVLFVGTGLLPLMDGGGRDLSIADSVVTQQDVPGKLQNFESNQDRLSRATIQEKLSGIPVFYLVDSNGSMGTSIYLAYDDAKAAADESTGTVVKATSLDQVM